MTAASSRVSTVRIHEKNRATGSGDRTLKITIHCDFAPMENHCGPIDRNGEGTLNFRIRKETGLNRPPEPRFPPGVKNLLILRHATSAAQGTDGTDFTRPLTGKGIKEASIQGRFLKEAGILPSHIGSSSAHRAWQTTLTLAETLGTKLDPSFHDALYNAPGDEILGEVRQISDGHDTALIVAHMPGVAEILDLLTPHFAEIKVAITPGTMAGISFRSLSRWAEIEQGTGALEWLLPPLLMQN